MPAAVQPPDEARRLAQLHALALLDSDPEERFDRITRLAQRLFGVPIALVSLIDADRQWFKSHQGLEVSETPREAAFCAHAILGDDVLQVADATADPRFADNPLVLGAPDIRFYAGAPIEGPDGAKLGTICIIDRQPRELAAPDLRLLEDLAEMVEREVAVASLATTDALTGLTNRRGFDLIGAEILKVCGTRGLSASLLLMDLDGLKRINDELGHEAGDSLLQEFAGLLTAAFRGSDLIARLGGDEFVVMLVGAPGPEPGVTRLRASIAARNEERVSTYRLGVSIGAAVCEPGSPRSLTELAAEADAAMYVEKQASRNASVPI